MTKAVDPAFRDLLAEPRNAARRPPQHIPMEMVRAAAKAAMATLPGPDIGWQDREVSGVRVRFYQPSNAPEASAMVFFHGGGFVFGDLDTHDRMCRVLALAAHRRLVAVDYRRSPEARYPAAVDDACCVIEWLSEALGGDDGAIALVGDSAGAHIALTAALRRPAVVGQLSLIYPILDPACASASAASFGDGFILTRNAMKWFWECYLAGQHNPLEYADFGVLPPTTVVTAGFDPLRDEGLALADEIAAAGVAVTRRHYAAMIHGFVGMPHLTGAADEALAAVAADISAALK